MSFDLNLDNYKYDDLSKLFHLKGHSTNQIKAIHTKKGMVKGTLPNKDSTSTLTSITTG